MTFAGCSSESSAGDAPRAGYHTYLLPQQYLNNNNPAYLIFNKYETLQESIPANFRTIEDYHILASAQFNVKQFQTATKDYPGIMVIDLRGEYHGLINDLPVSFKALPYNDINANKNHDVMIAQEQFIFNSILPKLSQISIYVKNLNVPPTKSDIKRCTQIKNSITESEAMTNINTMYYRIPVLDHSAPSATNLDALVVLYDTVLRTPHKQWVYLHCHAGKGRTAAATAELIMLKNKKTLVI